MAFPECGPLRGPDSIRADGWSVGLVEPAPGELPPPTNPSGSTGHGAHHNPPGIPDGGIPMVPGPMGDQILRLIDQFHEGLLKALHPFVLDRRSLPVPEVSDEEKGDQPGNIGLRCLRGADAVFRTRPRVRRYPRNSGVSMSSSASPAVPKVNPTYSLPVPEKTENPPRTNRPLRLSL